MLATEKLVRYGKKRLQSIPLQNSLIAKSSCIQQRSKTLLNAFLLQTFQPRKGLFFS
jgi:hypothetical protein